MAARLWVSPLIRVMSWLLVAEVIGVGGFVAVQVFGGRGAPAGC